MGKMAQRWKGFFKKENDYLEASAEHSFDAHADPRIQIEQATRAAMENHQALQQSSGAVIGGAKMAEAKLARLQRQEAEITNEVQVELKAGNQDKARSVALQLATVRQQITSQQAFVENANTQVATIKTHLQESEEEISQLQARRDADLADIDNAQATEAFNAAVAGVSGSGVDAMDPTFADVEAKIASRKAVAEGMSEVAQYDPNQHQLEIHHDMLNAQADDILAEFQTPAAPSTPAATTEPVGTEHNATKP